jgi:putative ABC transport system substrate-binding protein
MDRRTFTGTLAGTLIAATRVAVAQQQPARIYRIGFLGTTSASEYAGQVEALRAGLRDLGYVEGKNIVIEFRWADGHYDRLPELAAELVRLNVDIIVTHGTLGARVAMQATKMIPIVMAIGADAILTGLVTSLARPGGNLTGSTILNPELSSKRLALLKEAVPRITRAAVVVPRDNPSAGAVLQSMETTARSLRVALQFFEVRGPSDFESAFSEIGTARVDAVLVFEDPMLIVNSKAIAELAAKYRLASAGFKEFAEAGGLIGYGADTLDVIRHAAVFVDKILKGAKPGDLPIEQATRFELLINLWTAKVLGIAIPQSVLTRADKVIQ